jgi:predicted O-methyltransferase YrrM
MMGHKFMNVFLLILPICAFCGTDVSEIDALFKTKQIAVTEGHLTQAQSKQFSQCLKKYPHIRSIMEIGFNAGHSCEWFFKNVQGLDLFYSFDIAQHPYVAIGRQFFERDARFKDRFRFVPGNSLDTVPQFSRLHPHMKFDLIYIDGGHQYEVCLGDIVNCKDLAHVNTIVWIDDYNYYSV